MPETGTSRSQVRLCNPRDGSRVLAWETASVCPIAAGTGEWTGIRIELVRNRDWSVDDLQFDGHFIGLNLSRETLQFDARCGHGDWMSLRLPPDSFWIVPEGQRFSVRKGPDALAAAAIIDGALFDAVLGCRHQLETCSACDVGISHLFRALIELGQAGSHPELIRSLVHSFVLALAMRYGSPPNDEAWPDRQLQPLLDWIDEHLDESLSVERIAAHVGMAPRRFARAFKHATRRSPWAHVVEQRLLKAARLLREGESAAIVADRCGFSDQAHLSRLFKRQFGISPVAYSLRRQ